MVFFLFYLADNGTESESEDNQVLKLAFLQCIFVFL